MIRQIRRRLARPFRNRAKTAQKQRRWSDALFHLRLAQRIDPTNRALTLQIGNMQNEVGDHAAAIASFDTLLASPEHGLRATIGLAGVAERQQDWMRALTLWEAALTRMAAEQTADPNSTTAWPMSPARILLQTALCRHRLGDQPLSERDLMLAFALEPATRRERAAVVMRARLLEKADVRGAYRLLKAAHRRYPDDHTILFDLTRSAVVAGDREEAEGYGRALVAMAPTDQTVRDMLRDRALKAADA